MRVRTLCVLVQRAGACTHWLSVVMVEMTAADTAKYKTSVLAFINALLHRIDDLVERCRVREQLLAGQLRHIFYLLRFTLLHVQRSVRTDFSSE